MCFLLNRIWNLEKWNPKQRPKVCVTMWNISFILSNVCIVWIGSMSFINYGNCVTSKLKISETIVIFKRSTANTVPPSMANNKFEASWTQLFQSGSTEPVQLHWNSWSWAKKIRFKSSGDGVTVLLGSCWRLSGPLRTNIWWHTFHFFFSDIDNNNIDSF